MQQEGISGLQVSTNKPEVKYFCGTRGTGPCTLTESFVQASLFPSAERAKREKYVNSTRV